MSEFVLVARSVTESFSTIIVTKFLNNICLINSLLEKIAVLYPCYFFLNILIFWIISEFVKFYIQHIIYLIFIYFMKISKFWYIIYIVKQQKWFLNYTCTYYTLVHILDIVKQFIFTIGSTVSTNIAIYMLHVRIAVPILPHLIKYTYKH